MCRSSPASQHPQPETEQSSSQTLSEQLLAQVPEHPACLEALSKAQSLLPPSIFNHSVRVYLYALKALNLAPPDPDDDVLHLPPEAPAVDQSVLFVSCILHDIGASTFLATDPKRFEVAGATYAAALLGRHGFDPVAVRESWLSIAMHDSPHVAEGAGGLVRLVRLAVLADFGSVSEAMGTVLGRDYVDEVEALLPRLRVEKELGDAVVSQARTMRSKAPGGSWPGDLLRAAEENPEWEGVNKEF